MAAPARSSPLDNLALIGYRGTGKSAVARLLAARWGWHVVDADDEIEQRAGKSIKEIFSSVGESGFRDLECDVVADLCQRENSVLSLGGGAVLRPENRDHPNRHVSAVVWLTAQPETILARIEADAATASRRPNLTAAGGIEEIVRLLTERQPLYRACATFVVSTDNKLPQQVADEILQRLQPLD